MATSQMGSLPVTNMRSMFNRAAAFSKRVPNGNVSFPSTWEESNEHRIFDNVEMEIFPEWDVSSVITWHLCFAAATAFNGDISGRRHFHTYDGMFNGAAAFRQTLCWDLTTVSQKVHVRGAVV
jgi:hypothetical protein